MLPVGKTRIQWSKFSQEASLPETIILAAGRIRSKATGCLCALICTLAVMAFDGPKVMAQEVVLDFESVRNPLYPRRGVGRALFTVIKQSVVKEDGFKFVAPKNRRRNVRSFAYWDPAAPGYLGSVALQPQEPFGRPARIVPIKRGQTFRLRQFDFANCCERKGSLLTITGRKANGSTIQRKTRVSGDLEFRTLRFSPAWSDLQALELTQSDFTQFDNIVLNLSAGAGSTISAAFR